MANFLDKVKIPTAINHNTSLDLSCDHITTANFMQYNIAYRKELVPGEHIDVDVETFTRMEPLVAPTFGRCNIYNRAFFVPFRTVERNWNNFITDTPYNNGTTNAIVSNCHMVGNDQILAFLTSQYASVGKDNLVNQDLDPTMQGYVAYDFYTLDTAHTTTATTKYIGYKLNSAGRQAYKILTSLGYAVNTDLDDESFYSALPLLSVAKIYTDWYFPQSYANTDRMADLEKFYNSNVSLELSGQDLETIFAAINQVCYDSDYFTSQYDRPFSPNQGLLASGSLMEFKNPANYLYGQEYNKMQSVRSSSAGAYLGSTGVTTASTTGLASTLISKINQYSLDSLKALTDYLTRHQIVGGRAMDRYFSRFGIQLSSEKLNRSEYLGSDIVPVQIGDVMSNSDTNGASLGDYAGKGLGYGRKGFSYDAEEYGMFIIVSTIIPSISYYQGQDRNTMHISKLDYYTPEFDNLSVQATSRREIFCPLYGGDYTTTHDPVPGYLPSSLNDGIYGYLPRYAEYKCAKSTLSGDFRLHSRNVGLDSWHLMRELPVQDIPAETSGLTHNMNFVIGLDAAQYSRIFQNTDGENDHFKVIYHFNVQSQSPMSSLFDNYHFETEGEAKTVRENAGGVKFN